MLEDEIDHSRYDEVWDIPYRIRGERKWRNMKGLVRYRDSSVGQIKKKEIIVIYDPDRDVFITFKDDVDIMIIKNIETHELVVNPNIVGRTRNIAIIGDINILKLGEPNEVTVYTELEKVWCFGRVITVNCNDPDLRIEHLRISPHPRLSHIYALNRTNIIDLPKIFASNKHPEYYPYIELTEDRTV